MIVRSFLAVLIVSLTIAGLGARSAQAQATSNTWDTDAPGNWTDVLNWTGDALFAEGAGNTATFGDFISADRIVTLNAGITIGNIIASDTSNNYTISGANILTLDDTGTPTIDVTTAGRTLTISSQISGNEGLEKVGAGVLTLSNAASNYTGKTTVTGGTLSFNSIANVGAASALGAPVNAAEGTIDAAGALTYTGGTASTNRVINTTGAVTFNHNGAASTLTLNGNITGSAGVFFRANASNKNFTVNGVISTNGSVGKTDDFTLTLSNANNSFTGGLDISKGVVSINSIADIGVSSAAGAGSYIRLGQTGFGNQGTLRFTGGSGGSSNREIRIQSNAANVGGVIENTVADELLTLSGAVTLTKVAATGPLTLTGAGNGLLSGVVGGNTTVPATPEALTITKSGAGTWTLSNSNIYTSTTTINQGTLSINSIGDVGGGPSAIGNPSSAANGRIVMGNGNNTGTLLYTGAAASSDRTIQINSSNNTDTGGATITNNGSGPLTFTAGTFNNTYTNGSSVTRRLTLNGTNGGEIEGIIRNNSATNLVGVTKGGTGTWTLSGPNTYSGGTIIGNNTANVGTLNITHSSALGTGTVSIVSNAGSGNFATLTLNSGTGITLANNFSTSGEGQGGNGIIRNITGNNEVSGTITLIGGGGSTKIQSDGGSLTLSNTIAPSTTLRVLILSGSADGTVSGAINDGAGANTLAGLTKQGNGTWTLTNTNNYTGPTTVSAGTLLINGSLNAASAVTVNGGTLGGSGDIGGPTLVNASGTLAPGNSIGNLTINSTLGLAGMAAFEINDTANTADLVDGITTLTYGGTLTVTNPDGDGDDYFAGQTFNLFDFSNMPSGAFTSVILPTLPGGLSWNPFGGDNFDYANGQIQVVPEPSTWLLASLGLVGIAIARRRK